MTIIASQNRPESSSVCALDKYRFEVAPPVLLLTERVSKKLHSRQKKRSIWEFSSSNLWTILLLTAELLFWKGVEMIQMNPKIKHSGWNVLCHSMCP